MPRRLAILGFLIVTVFQQHTGAQAAKQAQRIILLVDSGNGTQKMVVSMRAGLLAFLDDLPGSPELAYITTGGQLLPRVKPTTSRAEVRAAVESFTSQGGANAFIEALSEAYDRFHKPAEDKRPVFVIVTTESSAGKEGDLNIDRYNRFAQSFASRGGRAYAIVIGGVTRGYITDVARHISENTGGRFERIGDATALSKLLREIAASIGAQQ